MPLKNFSEFNTTVKEVESQDTSTKIIATEWRTAKKTVGIVAVELAEGTWCAYIGVADGKDAKADARDIADYGARLTKQEALAFFPHLKDMKYKNEK